MAWIAVDLDNTLISKKTNQAEPGAVEAMEHLLSQGHKVSIWTARFQAMPAHHLELTRKHIEKQLKECGIPYSDIWVGRNKPNVDCFLGDNLVPYKGDWRETVAATKMFLENDGYPNADPGGASDDE